jgi:hypothetical protein
MRSRGLEVSKAATRPLTHQHIHKKLDRSVWHIEQDKNYFEGEDDSYLEQGKGERS